VENVQRQSSNYTVTVRFVSLSLSLSLSPSTVDYPKLVVK